MSKQYGQNRRFEDRSTGKTVVVGTKPIDRRTLETNHSAQLLWSFAVAVCLVLAAVLQWTAPKNALMENDRAPAQIRFDSR